MLLISLASQFFGQQPSRGRSPPPPRGSALIMPYIRQRLICGRHAYFAIQFRQTHVRWFDMTESCIYTVNIASQITIRYLANTELI